jgi:predicted transposase/invertase (TIGR01784 family)
MQMSRADQLAYERHLDAIMVQNDSFDAARLEGRAEGLEMGRAEGLEMGRAEGMEMGRTEGAQGKAMEIAKKMKAAGMSDSDIANMTGLSVQEISDLR